MKKAIFLVEDIADGKVYTLLEQQYKKLSTILNRDRKSIMWLSEITRLLYNHPSDWITFVKISDFIKQGAMPLDRDVFYFISCFHNLDVFSLSDLLLIDPEVSDFLVKHKIPIVIDSSMEICDHTEGSYRLLEESHLLKNQDYFRGLDTLDFFIVGSTAHPNKHTRPRTVSTFHAVFPGPFFQYNYKGSDFNKSIIENRGHIVDSVTNRTITQDTLIWHAFSNKTRVNRGLFFMKAQHEGLIETVGSYSRLVPGKDYFIKDCNQLGIDINDIPYSNDHTITMLDQVKVIDSSVEIIKQFNNFKFLFWISLETFSSMCPTTVYNTTSFLTEKTAMAIASGCPFIPLGGQNLGTQLFQFGFKDFEQLRFSTQASLFDEVDYVIDCVKNIKSLSLKQKQDLYDSWKHTVVSNYDRYLTIDIKRNYLKILNKSRHLARVED
jgi:hypothetical protein